jgi:NHLM bacteriocin system ABC transporter peptidase/ATP-binding protein
VSKSQTKVKSPKTKGVARVPVIMQLEALECGAASLAMIMAYYGKWIPLEKVRVDCGVSRDGANARALVNAAGSYGFKTHAYKCEPENLQKEGKFPCIIHWNFNHFVVLDGFQGKYVWLNDPARGVIRISMEDFDKSFTGIVIEIEPAEGFQPEGKPKSTLAFAITRLGGASSAVMLVMFTSVISAMFGIINPTMSRVFMDRILTLDYQQWLMPFIILMAWLAFLQIVVELARVIYSLKINGKLAIVGSSSYMWKIFFMPVEFFSQRMAGDIQMRRQDNESIAEELVNTFAPLLINVIMMVLYLVLMLRRSLVLTAVGLSAMLLNAFIARKISEKRVNITRVMQRDMAKLASTTASGIEMIETIKASGAEKGFFKKWSDYQASISEQVVQSVSTDNYLGMVPAFLSTMANYTVMILGVWLVMEGEFTLGAMQMFQGFLGSFMTPAMTMIKAGQSLQEMRTKMERIEDVMEYPDDEYVKNSAEDLTGLKKLTGEVELKNITFGYSKLGKPVITDFSMKIKPGSCVALVGMSGSGKSTISKLISGLYNPWQGEILFDGKKRSEYPREVMTGSIGVVDQDIIMFEGSISDNIRMWDDSIADFEIIMAARDAGIHDEIMVRDRGYNNRIVSGGRDLSGGQCQRLEIARVLAQTPSIIILDEATSALDAKTENEVMKAIRERGITCIVVAHRLSTIRDCDEIIVLDKGVAVERGTHDELVKLGGKYLQLVTNE